jgi:lipoprotein-anchoring transpeptidase ErfK/SrfK
MLRFCVLAIVGLAGVVSAGAAQAASNLVVPRAPAVLSPDLTEPWLVQLRFGKRRALSYPAPRTAALARPAIRHANAPAGQRPIDPRFLPQLVDYSGSAVAGAIVIDTEAKFLYLVMEGGKARRYGVGVGRPGFEWAGVHTITRTAEWPDWVPPDEMRLRRPDLPLSMKGGVDNPLGARALYLGSTLYRIHGSNEPWTIGQAVSSGCIRMRNEDVIDLYERVKVGTKVIVI